MTDQFCRVGAGRQVCYRTDGDPSGTPLLLIAGLTLDLTSWPRAMVDGLVAQRFYVIRFDNRDVGRPSPTTSSGRRIRGAPRTGLARKATCSKVRRPPGSRFRCTRLHGFAGRLPRRHLPVAVVAVGAESPAAAAHSRPAAGHSC